MSDQFETISYTDETAKDYLVQNICWPSDKDILQELKSLQAIARCFSRDIKLARNKLLAHLDMSSVLLSKPLGESPEGKDEIFFCALQKLCNIAHEACFGTIYGEMSPITVGGGDVINLRKTLECAVAFEEALSESSGQEKTHLLLLWQKAGHEPKPFRGEGARHAGVHISILRCGHHEGRPHPI